VVKFFPPANDQKVPGSASLYPDSLSRGHIGLIWGEAGVGKTTLVLQAALNEASEPSNLVLYINTHQYPTFQRAGRLFPSFPAVETNHVQILTHNSFRELRKVVMGLEYIAYLAEKGGSTVTLIIIDSITSLYTLSIGKKESAVKRNQELNEIFGTLKDLAKRRNLPVLVTAEEKLLDLENIIERKPAGGRIMNYWADFSLKIERGREEQTRDLIIRKNPSSMQEKWGALVTDAGLFVTKKI
jgi:predicted ATP-dependent serine protease